MEYNTIKKLQLNADTVYLKLEVTKGAVCAFSFGANGEDYILMGSGFEAKELKWVGAGIGPYCFSNASQNVSAAGGFADFEWFRVTYRESNEERS